MCGRFSLTVDQPALKKRFKVDLGDIDWHPRYNIAPSQNCPVILLHEDKTVLASFLWGLLPHWSKSPKTPFLMINARSETIEAKPMFKNLIKRQRCLVPADGFYEWKKKVPFRVALKSEEPFAFAALWDSWQDQDHTVVNSFTILTTEANKKVAKFHDRMPVILKPDDEELWLDPTMQELTHFFNFYPADEMKCYEVSQTVNSWKHDTPECIQKIKKENK